MATVTAAMRIVGKHTEDYFFVTHAPVSTLEDTAADLAWCFNNFSISVAFADVSGQFIMVNLKLHECFSLGVSIKANHSMIIPSSSLLLTTSSQDER
jgi:hypothetical protein